MRIFVIAAAAGLLLAPATVSACPAAGLDKSASVDMSAAKKKAEKVEYMKSAAGPEPVAPKPKKKKKK